ncbi:MAG: sugar phosphate nucleotidyltransferase [Limnochordia bacterium]|jgi:mannose-1-phosphate guanylyltransferase/phosphomannomutase|nr:sugar phosphate nucleotidyltransferase [Limnochordia bacterium]MDI9464632.1 sugar phosphate nucleotidyltransferase [Bacillota bacterium]NLO94651.1 NTP transferase domain-containing protein [Bacillota bacterium]HOB40300.1 sugar phosphate nucleotidyltransferase [Limnochordia bacterium]HPP71883.1 sugar phosphate nucleotidyltransferase [Limnochordia bacterium]
MKAVIMAGGEGTRLRPLTCSVPKPMVPILNKPMMEHILKLLKRHGFSDIACTLWYLPQDVTEYFQDGSAWGLHLGYYIEQEPLGTAGSVKNAAQMLQSTFVVMSGDALTDIDLTSAVAFHREKGALATLVLTRVENPLNYGVVLTGESGRITQFLEKPTWSQVFSDTVNTGIYILEPEVLDYIAPGQKVDFSQNVFPELLRRGAPLFGYVAGGYWSDVGNLEIYRQAQKDCLDGKVSLELPDAQAEGIYIEEGVKLDPAARLEGPLYLGRGCRIGPGAQVGPYSVLGPFCQVDARASLKHALLWPGVRVGRGARLRGCVCGKNAIVEPDSAIYEGVVLGDKVRVGAMSIIAPKSKIWPEKIIPSGTRLGRSVIWGSQEQRPIFTKFGIAGDIRGSLTPETITQFGLSYAAFLGEGKKALVTCDFSPTADLAKQALVVGLRGGGVHVHDGGEVTGRLTRFGVQALALDGALHVAANPQDPMAVLIECWDERGWPLSKGEQRKIEGIYVREDYPRFGGADLGDFIQVAGLRKRYLRHLARHYPSGTPGFRVGLVMEPGDDPLGELIRDFFRLSGYVVVTDQVQGLPTVVVRNQEWYIQDEQGRRLSDQDWWKGFVLAQAAKDKRGVALPVNLSETVTEAAKGQGLQVQVTKLEPLFWMEAAQELGNHSGGEPCIFPHIEPLASLGELFSLVSSGQVALSSWQGKTHMKTAKVPCPWSEKGTVMRKLMENADPERTLYFDGIKEHTGSGWALVVPDDDEPVFRLYSEARTEAEAAGLIQHYTDLIRSYEREDK